MINEGDFLEVQYTAKTSDGVKIDERRDKPILVAAGKKQVIPGLDEALLKASEGKKEVIKIPAAKAFGERDASLVRLIPIQKFREQNVEPVPGMWLDLDNTRARVQSVSGGRVRVDFNHELAGIDLEYEYTVTKAYNTPSEKINALAKNFLQLEGDNAKLEGDTATIKVGTKTKKDTDYIMQKMRVIQMALQYVPEVKKVVFQEEYAKEL